MYFNVKDVPIVYLGIVELVMCMFAVGMAFGVTIAVGILFIIQVSVHLLNAKIIYVYNN